MTTRGISTPGEGSGARRDTSSAVAGPDWIQTGIFPPTLIECDVRVRLGLSAGSAQIQIEVHDPVTRELLAMRSRPPHDITDPHQPLAEAFTWLDDAVALLLNPEPF